MTESSFYDVKEEIKVQTIYETIFSYCLKCRKNTGKNLNVVKSKTGRIILLLKCAVSNNKKSKLFIEQEDKG